MDAFWVYVQVGMKHILDINGYDHMLFIIALIAIYRFSDWKKVCWLVTAFTIGHSLTLALSSMDVILIDQGLVETLIPITILLTAISNLFVGKLDLSQKVNFILAAIFGLIHGLGFSNFFKSLGLSGAELLKDLLAFNVGLEIGQILVIFALFILHVSLLRYTKMNHSLWTIILSVFCIVMSLYLIFLS